MIITTIGGPAAGRRGSDLGGCLARAVGRDIGRLAEHRGVFATKDPWRRSAPPPLDCGNGPSAAHAQALDQSAGSGIEILPDLAMGTQRNLADRKLARLVAAGAEQFDQRLGLRHFGLLERAGRA